jgi:hypothetical protein
VARSLALETGLTPGTGANDAITPLPNLRQR